MIQVHLNSNGNYWQAYWTTQSGERRRESLGSKTSLTKREAKAKCAEMERFFAESPGMAGADDCTLAQWRAKYPSLVQLSPRTIALVSQTFDALAEGMGANRSIKSVSKLMAGEWASRLKDRKSGRGGGEPISPNTIARYIRSARAIFQVAVDHDVIARNPFSAVKAPAASAAEWEYVSTAQVEDAMGSIDDIRVRKAMALARYAGLRRAEILHLEASDISSTEIVVQLRGRVENTKQRVRQVPLVPRLREILGEGKPVPMSNEALNSWLNRWDCPWKGKPLHSLRKSLETDWLQLADPLSVCKMLGNSPEVAARHYHKVLPSVAEAVRTSTKIPQ